METQCWICPKCFDDHDPKGECSSNTYADICLGRANRATKGPWRRDYGQVICGKKEENFFGFYSIPPSYRYENDAEFIVWARADVPELARRLKKACDFLKQENFGKCDIFDLLKELEAIPDRT